MSWKKLENMNYDEVDVTKWMLLLIKDLDIKTAEIQFNEVDQHMIDEFCSNCERHRDNCYCNEDDMWDRHDYDYEDQLIERNDKNEN